MTYDAAPPGQRLLCEVSLADTAKTSWTAKLGGLAPTVSVVIASFALCVGVRTLQTSEQNTKTGQLLLSEAKRHNREAEDMQRRGCSTSTPLTRPSSPRPGGAKP